LRISFIGLISYHYIIDYIIKLGGVA